MDIEELVKKHVEQWDESREQPSSLVRAALTELAAGYEQKILTLKNELLRESEERCRMSEAAEMLQERIRQLEARLGGYLTVGGGNIVHGTAEALARVQAYILLDSKHPVEARDTNRYFAKQLQAAELRIRQLEADKAEYDRRIVAVGGVAINSVSREYHDAEVARLNALYESAVKGRQDFRKAYRRQLEAELVPDGCVTVPVTPTDTMCEILRDAIIKTPWTVDVSTLHEMWAELLAAAPQPKKEVE